MLQNSLAILGSWGAPGGLLAASCSLLADSGLPAADAYRSEQIMFDSGADAGRFWPPGRSCWGPWPPLLLASWAFLGAAWGPRRAQKGSRRTSAGSQETRNATYLYGFCFDSPFCIFQAGKTLRTKNALTVGTPPKLRFGCSFRARTSAKCSEIRRAAGGPGRPKTYVKMWVLRPGRKSRPDRRGHFDRIFMGFCRHDP